MDPNIIVVEVLEIQPHPGADRLKVCKVDAGNGEVKQVVTNSTKIQTSDKAPLALHGAILSDGTKIKKGKLRGELSEGMFCGYSELGLTHDEDGIAILNHLEAAKPGVSVTTLFSDRQPTL